MCKLRNISLITLFCLTAVSTATAYELDDLAIESWTGAGPHEVVAVIDFWPYNEDADSFAFGHRFSTGSITGLELLEALHAADNGLTVAHSAGFVTDFWYDTGNEIHHTTYNWPDSYWSYWWSDDFGESWAYAATGAPDRILYHGDTDGWLALPGDDYESQPVTPLLTWDPGDMNCDGAVDFDDISPFVVALGGEAGYAAAYPDCEFLNADCDLDGDVDFDDIAPFIDLLGQ